MKRNVLLIPFLAVLTLLLVGFISADTFSGKNYIETEFNGVQLSEGSGVHSITGYPGETVPVRVTFKSDWDAEDVRVRVYMDGARDNVYSETKRFDIVAGSQYTKLLSLELPSDVKKLTKDFTLYVEVTVADNRISSEYDLRMQRESYTLEVLSVDYSSKVSAGETVPVSIVAKNNGFNDAEDVYVIVSIPELGISTRGYMGDLVPQDSLKGSDGEEDSAEKVVYMKIPSNAKKGVYEMKVELYNDDVRVSTTGLISVGESESTMVLASVKNKDLRAGETVTFELVIVNSANNVKVFNLKAASSNSLTISVPSVVTVDSGSSKTVPVMVTAPANAQIGTYAFTLDVEGEQVAFVANIVGGSNVSASVVALTVVLVIIFVVLLAVLVVLLTRREKPIEEVETSYY